MALNATVLTNSIVNTMTRGKDIPQETKDEIRKSWVNISNEIINHFLTYAEIEVTVPVADDDPTKTGEIKRLNTSTITVEGLPVTVTVETVVSISKQKVRLQ